VEEQQRLGNGLRDVDGVITPPDVGELVRKQRLDLIGRQACQRRHWKQDDRTDRPDDAGHVDEHRVNDAESAPDVKTGGEALRRRLPSRQRSQRRHPTQPAHSP